MILSYERKRIMTQISTFSPVPPVVAFMTDFGYGDGDVGVLKGVVLTITPSATLVDLTHAVMAQNIASGAWILAASYRYFPKGSVFVCVVDPGVGSARLPIAVYAGNWVFVGPDNGLFSYIYAEQPLHAVVALTKKEYHLPNTSHTFHGRDIFAPVAAHIAAGVTLSEVGTPLAAASLTRLEVDVPRRVGGEIAAQVVHVDNFGNLITNIPLHMVPDLFSSPSVQVTFPTLHVTVSERRRFFAENDHKGNEPFIYGDSSGYVGVAVRNGNAAKALGVSYGAAAILLLT